MKRRTFLKSSLAAAAATSLSGSALLAKEQAQEFYELRAYRVTDTDSQKLVIDYIRNGLLPALNRAGIDPVGVFTLHETPGDLSVFMIMRFKTQAEFLGIRPQLEADTTYLSAASAYYARPKETPAYSRVQSWFMKAFTGMPIMELSDLTKTKQPRLFEVRIYESHNEEMARRKIEMFNAGEIPVMREVGLAPLLYGETLIGDNLPNLTYIVSGPDIESHKKHWKAFGAHPEWNRLKAIDKYKGTVSKIVNYFLVPTEFSQI